AGEQAEIGCGETGLRRELWRDDRVHGAIEIREVVTDPERDQNRQNDPGRPRQSLGTRRQSRFLVILGAARNECPRSASLVMARLLSPQPIVNARSARCPV